MLISDTLESFFSMGSTSSFSRAEVHTSEQRVRKGRRERSRNFTKSELEEMLKIVDFLVNFSPRVALSNIAP